MSSTVPADITSALRRLGQHHRATMFMTCLAVFGSLLAVHSDQDDLIVGCAVAGRARREFNDLVGPLVNTVPIRLTVHESHATMIEATREAAATAFRYSDVPFAELVAELNPERIPGRQPVVDAYFQFQTNPLDGVTFGDLSVDRLPVGLASVAFDIELSITEVAGELRVSLGVDGDLFRPSTADALLAHYVGALAAWADRGPGS